MARHRNYVDPDSTVPVKAGTYVYHKAGECITTAPRTSLR